MIIGRPGSGKSTFSVQLQKKLNLPLFHLDKYFFEKNWVERDYQEFLSSQKEMISLARSGDLEQNSGKIRAIPGLLVHSPYSQNGLSTSP
ncbi:hypothetical protein [Legionella sp. km772]|uniref:hypothetical protein n=1 Tax=Legionella sp. km772 TaxID=2498111 RepID=UPI00131559AA|nr:hypothetical protein [Legionella sp. km772]